MEEYQLNSLRIEMFYYKNNARFNEVNVWLNKRTGEVTGRPRKFSRALFSAKKYEMFLDQVSQIEGTEFQNAYIGNVIDKQIKSVLKRDKRAVDALYDAPFTLAKGVNPYDQKEENSRYWEFENDFDKQQTKAYLKWIKAFFNGIITPKDWEDLSKVRNDVTLTKILFNWDIDIPNRWKITAKNRDLFNTDNPHLGTQFFDDWQECILHGNLFAHGWLPYYLPELSTQFLDAALDKGLFNMTEEHDDKTIRLNMFMWNDYRHAPWLYIEHTPFEKDPLPVKLLWLKSRSKELADQWFFMPGDHIGHKVPELLIPNTDFDITFDRFMRDRYYYSATKLMHIAKWDLDNVYTGKSWTKSQKLYFRDFVRSQKLIMYNNHPYMEFKFAHADGSHSFRNDLDLRDVYWVTLDSDEIPEEMLKEYGVKVDTNNLEEIL